MDLKKLKIKQKKVDKNERHIMKKEIEVKYEPLDNEEVENNYSYDHSTNFLLDIQKKEIKQENPFVFEESVSFTEQEDISCEKLQLLDGNSIRFVLDEVEDIPSGTESEDGEVSDNEEHSLLSSVSSLEVGSELLLENNEGDPGVEVIGSGSYTPKWRKRVYTQPVMKFEELVGPSCIFTEHSEVLTPCDVFNMIFSEELYELIAFQSNLFAIQKGTRFIPTNPCELKKFLAINMLMGIKKMPSYRDYWSSDPIYRDSYISNIMGIDRFKGLLSNLHINDNTKCLPRGHENFDKLYKIRPFLTILGEQFGKCYHPSENQSIDESMIKFKGRIDFKQYMPLKPIKRGYKIWVRADCYGYVSQFELYTGKSSEQNSGVGLGERVVKSLCSPLLGKSYKIYADNFFSNISIAHYLGQNKIGYCGTIRSNRKLMPQLASDKTLKRGDFDWKMDSSGISVTKWMDKGSVYIISNMHDPSETYDITRKNKDGTVVVLNGNKGTTDYNTHMGYVDKADMMKSIYELDRKSKKWWHRIFFHFIDVILVNSFIIYKHLTNNMKLPLKDFKVSVIHGLVGATVMKVKSSKRLADTLILEAPRKHKTKINAAIRLDKSAGHMPICSGNWRRCNFCSTAKEPHRTRWECNVCHVSLCNNSKRECFQIFHQKR